MSKDNIDFILVRSRRKTIEIQIKRNGEVSVKAPIKCPIKTIEQFLTKKRKWIESKIALIENTDHALRDSFAEGDSFSYLGRKIRLAITEGADKPLELSEHTFFLDKRRLVDAKKVFIDWYKISALGVFQSRLALYEPKVGVRAAELKLSGARHRWGSCSPKGVIKLNWKLIMAPLTIIDYVVVHELCHIIHPNHSKKFWESVGKTLPSFKAPRKWIRTNGGLLDI